MKNFIFKSEADFHKIVFNKLDVILNELRHQRLEHSTIISICQAMLHDRKLQRQVDKYYDLDDIPPTPEDDNSNS